MSSPAWWHRSFPIPPTRHGVTPTTTVTLSNKPIALETWPYVEDGWDNSEVATEIQALRSFLSEHVNEPLEKLRQSKVIGQSLDAKAVISGPSDNPIITLLKKYEADLPELFILSQVTVTESDEDSISVDVDHADGLRCPRSWRWVNELVETETWGPVSPVALKHSKHSLNLYQPSTTVLLTIHGHKKDIRKKSRQESSRQKGSKISSKENRCRHQEASGENQGLKKASVGALQTPISPAAIRSRHPSCSRSTMSKPSLHPAKKKTRPSLKKHLARQPPKRSKAPGR